MSSAIQRGLAELHLQIFQKFKDERIEDDTFQHLTDQDLIRLGVETTCIGDRIRLREAMRKTLSLRTNTTNISSTGATNSLEENHQRSLASISNEISLLFGRPNEQRQKKIKGKKPLKKWTGIFVCLASRNQTTIPIGEEKMVLLRCGLGSHRVTIDLYSSQEEFFNCLEKEFPQLKKSGGFELLRCAQNCRNLKVLECNWKPESIRQYIGQQAKIYLRPIQNDLETSPSTPEPNDDTYSGMCEFCDNKMNVRMLRDHLKICSARPNSESDELPDLAPSHRHSSTKEPSTSATSQSQTLASITPDLQSTLNDNMTEQPQVVEVLEPISPGRVMEAYTKITEAELKKDCAPEMMSTCSSQETTNVEEQEVQIYQSILSAKGIENQKRLSLFAEHDLVLKIENTKLHVNKDQLIAESPVFKKMFTSEFKEKDQQEIELDGDLNDFVDFLRCTLPGIDEELTDKTVHLVTPLADEYQTTKTLQKADDFLSKKSRQLGDRISSQQVISNILQAESHNLTSYLEESIAIASRKLFSRLVANPKFKEISSETRMKIAFKRWSDVDRVFESSGNFQGITESTDFYQPYQMPVCVTPLMGGQSKPSGPHQAKPSKVPSGFSFYGQSGIVPTQDLNFNLKQFMQRN